MNNGNGISPIIDMILIPVKYYLELLKDQTIVSYLGVSVLGIAVTCMIVTIVVSALLNRVDAGAAASSIVRTQDSIKRRNDSIKRRQDFIKRRNESRSNRSSSDKVNK